MKNKYTIKEISETYKKTGEEIVVHCKTIGQAKVLITEANKILNGFSEIDKWLRYHNNYKEKMCYNLSVTGYSGLDFYKNREGTTIISFEQVLFDSSSIDFEFVMNAFFGEIND